MFTSDVGGHWVEWLQNGMRLAGLIVNEIELTCLGLFICFLWIKTTNAVAVEAVCVPLLVLWIVLVVVNGILHFCLGILD